LESHEVSFVLDELDEGHFCGALIKYYIKKSIFHINLLSIFFIQLFIFIFKIFNNILMIFVFIISFKIFHFLINIISKVKEKKKNYHFYSRHH